jgi:hypothetical protein
MYVDPKSQQWQPSVITAAAEIILIRGADSKKRLLRWEKEAKS